MANPSTFPVDLGWKTLLKDLKIRPDHVLRRAELPADLFARPQAGLSTAEYFRFWKSVEAEYADPMFPIRIVEAVSTEVFVPVIFASLCSKDMEQASLRISQYKRLVAPMAMHVAWGTQKELVVSPSWLDQDDEVPFSIAVCELAFLLKLIRIATREPIKALRVTLPTLPHPENATSYSDYFGVKLQKARQTAIAFSQMDAKRPFLTMNDSMWQIFEPSLRTRLSELEENCSTGDRVSSILLELLPSGAVEITAVAEKLAMSTRTLQRKLSEEKRSFRLIVNQTRERLAMHYLQKTSVPIMEIAFLLGFANPTSFFRAFQQWTGSTPEAVRLSINAPQRTNPFVA